MIDGPLIKLISSFQGIRYMTKPWLIIIFNYQVDITMSIAIMIGKMQYRSNSLNLPNHCMNWTMNSFQSLLEWWTVQEMETTVHPSCVKTYLCLDSFTMNGWSVDPHSLHRVEAVWKKHLFCVSLCFKGSGKNVACVRVLCSQYVSVCHFSVAMSSS